MQSITFTILGVPVAKARARIGKHGGYTPAKTKLYEKQAASCAREAMLKEKLRTTSESVFVEIDIFMPIPKSFSKLKYEKCLNNELRPIGKVDLDNCIKAVLDGQNTIVFVDDNQVCEIIARKFYSDNPRAEVKVSW